MIAWLTWLRDVATREPAALVHVLASEGSVPRGAGTRMLVTAEQIYGTIGGGQLEHQAMHQARAILAAAPGEWRVQDYPLGPLLGQCCGGRVRLLIEHVDPRDLGWLTEASEERILVSSLHDGRIIRHVTERIVANSPSARGERPCAGTTLTEIIGQQRRPIYMFGAGHVGQAVARHAQGLPFRLAWFDSRPSCETVDGVTCLTEDVLEDCIADSPAHCAIVILTHDHGLDYRLTKAALLRSPVAFVGLIGSATKRARFQGRLERDGVPASARARLNCPIGIAGACGKEPDVIAIATLAQLLALGRLEPV